jgi:predicted AlkP superfamily phosphohydrolase/phosphomutase
LEKNDVIMSKKILVIGIDQSIPYLIKKFMNEGVTPNISKLYQNGVYTEGLSCPPCDTPTNWTTIATGAPTGVHGAMVVQLVGVSHGGHDKPSV